MALNPSACSLQGKFTGEICHFMVYHSYHHLLFSLLMVEGDFLLVKKTFPTVKWLRPLTLL